MPPTTIDNLADAPGVPGDAGDDTLVQELYGTALSLQATGARTDTTETVRQAIADAVTRIDAVISVLRTRLES